MMIGPEQGKKPSGKSGKKKSKAKKAKRLAAENDLATPIAHEDHLTAPVVAASDPVEPAFGLASAVDPQPASQLDGASPSDPVPDAGPQLLAWIDRVQARVDHLLTLVDPAVEAASAESESEPEAAEPDPAGPAGPEVGPTAATETSSVEPAIADGADADAEATSLAEAWARRQQTAEAAAVVDDDPLDTAEAAAASEDDEALETAATAEATAATDDVAPLEPTVIVAVEQLLGSAEPEPGPVTDDEPFEPVDARLTAVLVARELIARGQSPADVRRRLREGYGVIDPDAVLAQIAA